VADGFSCRTQVQQAGTGRAPVHLAQLLADARGNRRRAHVEAPG